jgi:hypothetical protein
VSTAVRIGGFIAALIAVFAIAIGVGRAAGPIDDTSPDEHDAGHATDAEPESHGGHDEAASSSTDDIPGGLMVSQGGYTFALDQATADPGEDVAVDFSILGPDGRPVTDYDVEHEKQLHLIAVRRDFTGFQHVHPELGDDGRWTTELDLTAGAWRLFADFKAKGTEPLTLGTDLAVDGDFRPTAEGGTTRVANVDGYTVELDGDLAAGSSSELTLSVTKDGQPVTDLDPYLGAYGHLVALREGDLAYLHVHPDGAPGDGTTKPGPEVVFYASVPSAGRYRLYLDFKHDGVVRTAAFTVDADGPGPNQDHGESSGHGH